jgi:hypothetical protein
MIRCPHERELQRFADGELWCRRRSRIADHVHTCEACAREIRQLHTIGELVSGAVRKETEGHDLAGLWDRVREGIRPAPVGQSRGQMILALLWKPATRVAYAALVVLLGGFFLVRSLLPGPQPPVEIGRAQVYKVCTYDPEVSVSLLMASDGRPTIVWISGVEATEEN